MENWRRHIAKAEGVRLTEDLADSRPVYRPDLRVIVKTVEPLSPETVKAIADKVRRAYQREVLVEVELDPSLLGGLIVLIGHRVIDMSLATHLRKMSAKIADRLEEVVKELDRTWEDRLHDHMEEFLADMRQKMRLTPPQESGFAAAESPAAAPVEGEVLVAAPVEG